jgi:hypothetical protein
VKTGLRGSILLALASLSACGFMRSSTPVHADAAEASTTATEAYLYGFPLVHSYGFLFTRAEDPKNPEFLAPWNEFRHQARLPTPEDPNPVLPPLDTVTSWLAIDLRAEPLILTLPPLDKGRAFWVHLVDLLKTTPTWMSSRTVGTGGGSYLLARPGWTGEKPAGIKGTLSIDTDLSLAVFHLQVFGPADVDVVNGIHAGLSVQRLSAYLKKPAPPPPPSLSSVVPLSLEEERRSLRFFAVLAHVLPFCPAPMAERKFRSRLDRIGIVAGKPFDPQSLGPEIRDALNEGIADAWKIYYDQKKIADAKEIPIGDLPATPETPRYPFLARFAAAQDDPLDDSREVSTFPLAPYDRDGLPLDGSMHRYVLHFDPDQLPPPAQFWSLTIYDQPSGLLIRNPLQRYGIQSSSPSLKFEADGGLTFRVQTTSPGTDLESNWLPCSPGHFLIILRVYGAKPDSPKHRWAPPYLEKATQ